MKFNVLIAARSNESLQQIREAIGDVGSVEFFARVSTNGHVDALEGLAQMPSLLVMELGPHWEDQLQALTHYPEEARPEVIVVTPSESDVNVMRRAMQAGARDVVTMADIAGELRDLVYRILQRSHRLARDTRGRLIGVSGVKGGVGASFVATQLAGITAESARSVLLIDLELELSTLALRSGLGASGTLRDLLESDEPVDSIALQGASVRHGTGFHALYASADCGLDEAEYRTNLKELLEIATNTFDYVIVDIPRATSPVGVEALRQADHLLLVLQQSVVQLRNAKQLLKWIDADVRPDGLVCSAVVNRHLPKHSIRVQDIQSALDLASPHVVEGAFAHAAEADDLGIPLFQHNGGSPAIKTLRNVANEVLGLESKKPRLMERLFSRGSKSERVEPSFDGGQA